jgi:hypothetical protein
MTFLRGGGCSYLQFVVVPVIQLLTGKYQESSLKVAHSLCITIYFQLIVTILSFHSQNNNHELHRVSLTLSMLRTINLA